MNEYDSARRIYYGDEGATFVPVCIKCGRFVKADPEIIISDAHGPTVPNAMCKKCGRTEMLFEGYTP